MRLRFGDFVFDRDARRLTRGDVAVELAPKLFELLRILLEERPRVLSKEELHERLWTDTFVSDASLARLVSELREALGDEARAPIWVRTSHGYGYAFCGQAVEVGPATATPATTQQCWLVWGRRLVPLVEGENLLGRAPESVLMTDSPRVSRRHTRIVVTGDQATLEDLGSKNGTYVEGERVAGPVALRDGDQIVAGPLVLVFRCGGQGETTLTEPGDAVGERPGSPVAEGA